jgi:hypothetical protein
MREHETDSLGSPEIPEVTAFSNAVRLTGREWLVTGAFTVLFIVFAPSLWKQAEPCSLEPDHRMPHELSNDYWLYERYANLAAERYDTFLIGDSVIWGEYVTRHETLSHYLNELARGEVYANLGLDGAHPLALAGLVEHYGRSVSGKKVLLQCNPLWLTSPSADLQDDRRTVQHPRLIPQFSPNIPAYKEEMSTRIGVVLTRNLPLSDWTSHLQHAYYDHSDLPTWTLEHPYHNPIVPLTQALPAFKASLRHFPEPWYKTIAKQDYPWVDLDTSLQWPAFQRAVKILQRRKNQVFVLVGPFNEHLLTSESLSRYQEVKAKIAAWLAEQQIPHAVPPALASDLYGDASHPLAEGYAKLARQLISASGTTR